MIARLTLLLSLAGLSSGTLGCQRDESHAPSGGGCNDPGCSQPYPIGGGDAGALDATGDVADAKPTSDASTTVTGLVRPLSRFTADPTSVAEVASAVAVRAPKIGGGTTADAKPGLDGTFTLTDVAATIGGPTWLQVVSTGTVKAIDAVSLPQSAVFQIPLFDDTLAATTWTTLGLSTAYPAAPATIVVQVYDGKGARLSGVTATPYGDAKGPFYDDGVDVSPSAKATGTRGTVVFLGQSAGAGVFNVTLTTATKTYGTIAAPIGAGAVTWLALTLD